MWLLLLLIFGALGWAAPVSNGNFTDGNPNVAAQNSPESSCQVGDWSPWDGCSASGVYAGDGGAEIAAGVAFRTRSVLAVEQGSNSSPCDVALADAQLCSSLQSADGGYEGEVSQGAVGPLDDILNATVSSGGLLPCALGDWSAWGGCPAQQPTGAGAWSCGYAFEARTRLPLNLPCTVSDTVQVAFNDCYDDTSDCPANVTNNGSLVESRLCPVSVCDINCVVSAWSSPSVCGPNCAGTDGSQSRNRTILTSQGGSGDACAGPFMENRTCIAPCERDCKVSSFSEWSQCLPFAVALPTNGSTPSSVGNMTAINGTASPLSASLGMIPTAMRRLISGLSFMNASNRSSSDGSSSTCMRSRKRRITTSPTSLGDPCPNLTEQETCECAAAASNPIAAFSLWGDNSYLARMQQQWFGCEASETGDKTVNTGSWQCSKGALITSLISSLLLLLTLCGLIVCLINCCLSGDDSELDELEGSSGLEDEPESSCVLCSCCCRKRYPVTRESSFACPSPREMSERREASSALRDDSPLLQADEERPWYPAVSGNGDSYGAYGRGRSRGFDDYQFSRDRNPEAYELGAREVDKDYSAYGYEAGGGSCSNGRLGLEYGNSTGNGCGNGYGSGHSNGYPKAYANGFANGYANGNAYGNGYGSGYSNGSGYGDYQYSPVPNMGYL